MSLLKRTYSLPQSILDSFEAQVPAGERSNLIARLLQQWMDRERRARLRHEVAEGCAAMAEHYLEIEREFHPLEEEIERALEGQSKARRHRPRSSRPGRRIGTGG